MSQDVRRLGKANKNVHSLDTNLYYHTHTHSSFIVLLLSSLNHLFYLIFFFIPILRCPPREFSRRRVRCHPPSNTSVSGQTLPYASTISHSAAVPPFAEPLRFPCLLLLLKFASRLLLPLPTSSATVSLSFRDSQFTLNFLPLMLHCCCPCLFCVLISS